MLLGKLATPAIKVYQTSSFSSVTATAEYMIVNANYFVIGDSDTSFEVRFGNIVDETVGNERFDVLLRENVKMSNEELATWGTDDSIVLDLIATKLGTSIVEKITRNFRFTY